MGHHTTKIEEPNKFECKRIIVFFSFGSLNVANHFVFDFICVKFLLTIFIFVRFIYLFCVHNPTWNLFVQIFKFIVSEIQSGILADKN